ncbi:hypothetical protein OROGR_031841 [Orobanche gracilis]
MLAAPPIQPPKLWTPNTISTIIIRPPIRRRFVAFNCNTKHREERTGGGGDLGLAAQKSNVPPSQHLYAAKLETKTIPSGAVVLRALERAAAEKANKKREMREKRKTGPVSEIRDNQGAPCNLDNVRPLSVKPEWGGRLEELERRLQQLGQ